MTGSAAADQTTGVCGVVGHNDEVERKGRGKGMRSEERRGKGDGRLTVVDAVEI